MNSPKKICAYYSRGPHFTRNLKSLRQRFPDAEITALVPPGYPHAVAAAVADAVATFELRHYGPGDIAAFGRLISQIRAARYDLFVVMFDSPKLRVLASLSGAREAWCLTVDKRFFRLRLAFASGLAGAAYRNLRGRLTYARIWYIVHYKKVAP